MSLSGTLRASVEGRLGRLGTVSRVAGGSVSQAWCVETADARLLVKHREDAPSGFFDAEAEGLDALRAAVSADLLAPRVLGVSDASDGPAWIALEWLEPAELDPGFAERLGRGLAALHARSALSWGWHGDNFIGALPQSNGGTPRWATFWRSRRLEPQLRRALDAGWFSQQRGEWDRLLAMLPQLLAPADDDGPSLLHGDLWHGNVLCTRTGPALIDPAAYRGHREVDLAMARLFGGFDPRFFAAYQEVRPLLPGWQVRLPVYQLYFLLVHVNLFGGGYVEQTAGLLGRSLASRAA